MSTRSCRKTTTNHYGISSSRSGPRSFPPSLAYHVNARRTRADRERYNRLRKIFYPRGSIATPGPVTGGPVPVKGTFICSDGRYDTFRIVSRKDRKKKEKKEKTTITTR